MQRETQIYKVIVNTQTQKVSGGVMVHFKRAQVESGEMWDEKKNQL